MNIHNQQGFTIIQAIFIIVVLALLGTYMVRLSTVQQSTSTQVLLQARAYQAARSGIEWGISKIVNSASPNCFNDETWQTDGYTVNASCRRSGPFDEGAGNTYLYNLTAVASFAAIDSPDFVSRRLEVTIYD